LGLRVALILEAWLGDRSPSLALPFLNDRQALSGFNKVDYSERSEDGLLIQGVSIMDTNNPAELLKKGFQVSLGAATSLAESLQDERKREENLSQLNLGFDKVAEIWAEKGAVTELEGRKMIDNMMEQYGPKSSSYATPGTTPVPSTSVDPSVQQELRDLTAQLAAIRAEIDQTGSDPA
jgi:hypothetical protein